MAGIAAPVTHAQTDLFVDSAQYLGEYESTAVALGDLDGDGDPDAFVSHFDVPNRVWINQGAAQGGVPGSFVDSAQALGAAMNNAAVDVALGDLDGDGDLDAFVVRDAFGDSNEVWINQGGDQGGTEGVFQLNGQTFGDNLTSAVALGDLDGDSDLDAFVVRSNSTADKVWLNDGSGQFSDSGQPLGADSSIEVALGDLDGDNDLDAFVATGAANKVWRNEGGAQMGTPGNFMDSGQSLGMALSLGVALGDLDGDNDLDAFVANSGLDAVWFNDGAGQFSDSGQPLGMAAGRDVALGDLDGDDDLDAFVANSGGNTVWINQGGAQAGTTGVFSDAGLSLGAAFSDGVALGDLGGDDDLDAFVANGFSAPDKVWTNTTVDPRTQVNPFGWQIEFADIRGDAGRGVSLALDSNDDPQITHIRFEPHADGRDYVLLHERWDGVRWLGRGIDRVVDVPFQAVTSLALDAAGNAHVAYAAQSMGVSGPQLKYARFDGAQWQVEVVDANTDVEAHVSLALDGTGNPHISYARDPDDVRLYYAFFDGAVWTWEQVDATPLEDVGGFNALALNSADEPRIAYHVGIGTDDLRYARRSGGGWTIENVQAGDVDGYIDLIVDSAGVPHISFIADFFQDVRYATKPGASWQIENATDLGASSVISHTALVLDAMGRPHVSYAPDRVIADPNPELEYARRDPGGWTIQRIDQRGEPGFYNSLALDAGGNPRIAYSEETNGDLRFASFDRRWQTQPVDSVGTSLAPAVDVVNDTLPELGYYDLSSGQIKRARWDDGAWMPDPAAFAASPVGQLSLVRPGTLTFMSYYDAGAQRLMFAANAGAGWTATEIDASADVGRYNRLLFVDGAAPGVRIAYWDATNGRVKLALFSGVDPATAVLTTNAAGPTAVDPASGPLGATVLAGGDIGVSYYDGTSGDLRLATWDAETGTWADEPVATAGDAGAFNDIATDGTTGFPVIAYHDATSQAIRYGHRDGAGVWQLETAASGVVSVGALALELGLDSRLHPRIAFIDTGDDALRLALERNGGWYLETAATLAGTGDLDLALGHRPHLALTESGVGLSHVFRTATLDVLTSPYAPPPPGGGYYNPLDACRAFLGLILGDSESGTKLAGPVPSGPAPSAPLSDEEIFRLLPAYFGQNFDGQHYVDLYSDHGAEMGQLALADMDLLSDSYGMLQNFMPGLEALVSGQGDELLISQQMVDDALSVWQRLAAAGSPELAQTINAELSKYDNLQDFVGMSFDEWFASLKGETIFANGFE